MSNPKRVILIGSGCSNELAGIPTQREFWAKILKHIKNSGLESYHEALRLRLKLVQGFNQCIKNLNYRNIEEIFSSLHDLNYLSKDGDARRAALDLILFYRSQIAIFLRSFKSKVEKLEKLRKINKIWAAAETTIVSLNYDELFEDDVLGRDKFYYCNFLDNILDLKENKFKILKLHGSVSWLENRYWSDKMIFESYSPLRLQRGSDEEYSMHRLDPSMLKVPIDKAGLSEEAATPIIIPFFRQKLEWYSGKWGKIFNPIYRHCSEVLSQCDELIIVGYGMPEGDWTVRRLLIGASKFINNVKLINKERRPVMYRFKKVFKNVEHVGSDIENYLKNTC